MFIFLVSSTGCIDSKTEQNINVDTSIDQDKNVGTAQYPPLNNTSLKKGLHVAIDGPAYNLVQLKHMSTCIILGNVTEILPSKWSSTPRDLNNITNDPIIYTDVNINVEKYLKEPQSENNIMVRTMGGETEDYIYDVDTTPKFKVGERVLLFLSNDTNPVYNKIPPEHYEVVGYDQGKYTLNENGTANTLNGKYIGTNELISSISSI